MSTTVLWGDRMPDLPPRVWLLLCLLTCAVPASAQDSHRIWGQVQTVSGERYEGFLRWDRNEGSWVDVLDGSKQIPDENYLIWLEANKSGQRPIRTIELMGYRISWDEEDADFPSMAASGIRFGHLAALTVLEDDRVGLDLRSGERVELSGGATDIGPSIRELLVDDPHRGRVELVWSELERIDFSAVPADASAESPRLFGTVEDQGGRRFTGYISWDLDEIFESDILDGYDDDGHDQEIPFREIRSIEGRRREVTVTLKSGETVVLSGTNDVNRSNRGVQISDPDLGMVEVEWDEFRILRLREAPPPVEYGAFDGGHLLLGTLTTQSGEEITGRIRWDADEEWSWEFLNGRSDEVKFTIEFGKIDRIRRGEALGATVTLVDGRAFELDDSNDVDWDNKGILMLVDANDASELERNGTWRFVAWDEFLEVRFDHRVRAEREGGGES